MHCLVKPSLVKSSLKIARLGHLAVRLIIETGLLWAVSVEIITLLGTLTEGSLEAQNLTDVVGISFATEYFKAD